MSSQLSVVSKEVFVKPKEVACNNGAGFFAWVFFQVYGEADKAQIQLIEPQGTIKKWETLKKH